MAAYAQNREEINHIEVDKQVYMIIALIDGLIIGNAKGI